MVNACHNRKPFSPTTRVQDGLTQDRLKEVATYDPDTGVFRRRPFVTSDGRQWTSEVNPRSGKGKGYAKFQVDGALYLVHRLAFLYMTGSFPSMLVDHIDGDIKNNRWSNLREATYQQNTQANHRGNRNNTSGFRGVYWVKSRQRWQAKIMVNKKEIHLGFFECPLRAHEAYRAKKAEVHFR